jgi:putative ABC transport system permease protein
MSRSAELSSIRVGLETLRVNLMRTFLSMLGVVIGVAALVAVLSVGDGMQSYFRSQVTKTTAVQNVFVNVITSDTVDGLTIPRDRFHLFGAADADAARAGIAGINGVMVSLQGTSTMTGPSGGRRRAARVTAALAGVESFYGIDMAAGRFFTEAEARHDVPVAVLTYVTAQELAGSASPETMVGKTIRMRASPRRVIGVVAPEKGDEGLAAFVPLSAAQDVMLPGQSQRARTLLVQAARVEDVEATRNRVEDWMATSHPRWERDFKVETQMERLEQTLQAFGIFKMFMGAVTAISLVVGGIGIMNVLLASVTERTREIGIRKATGARRRDILLQFLAESVAISGTGSGVGLVLGLSAAALITALMRNGLEAEIYAGVSLTTLAVTAFSALAVGLTFGTYPARRAARLSPIDAIRHE